MVADQKEWSVVAKELEDENLKLASYDNTLMSVIGDVTNKTILDYGAGPGILALGLQKMGADAKVWDIGEEMRTKAATKIGIENIYSTIDAIEKNSFDAIICNLVLCIVPEDEVKSILKNIKDFLNDAGSVYIGFCNPKIFTIAESHLDYRFPTGNAYEDNHDYKKVKKEGAYEIIETHRPITWYQDAFADSGLKLVDTFFTPTYELNGETIEDFVIFKLQKK